LTDSKRTTQDEVAGPGGRRKSLRYQATVPSKLARRSSVAFQAFGTLIGCQPSVESCWAKPWLRPTPSSKRNSHWPSRR